MQDDAQGTPVDDGDPYPEDLVIVDEEVSDPDPLDSLKDGCNE